MSAPLPRPDGPPIAVLLCVDDGYIAQACVAIGSMLLASRSTFEIIIAAIDRDAALWQRHLGPLEAKFPNCSIEVVDVNAGIFSSLPMTAAVTLSTYTRVLLDGIMAGRGDRVIYLDADIVVLGDLADLWHFPLHDVAAVAPDPFNINRKEIGFAPDEFYFNAGVMLVDVAAWRKAGIGAAALQSLAANPNLPWLDQDALNIALRGKTVALALDWNFQPRCADVAPEFLSMTAREYRQARRAPRIVHFTTSHKPWNRAWRVHYSKLYFDIVAKLDLDLALHRSRPTTMTERILSLKTMLRWGLPSTFRMMRSILRPGLAARSYSAGPDGRITGKGATAS